MASRRLEDLHPSVAEVAKKHVLRCADEGISLLVYCTLRDPEEQARLYWQGRTAEQVRRRADRLEGAGCPGLADLLMAAGPQEGPKVTFAGPGESYHQYGLAYDCVPMVAGKPEWRTTGEAGALWQTVGAAGQACDLEWAGGWQRFREFPHFQMTGGATVRELMVEHYSAPLAADVRSVALPGIDESAMLRNALDEANTVFLVFATGMGADDDELRGRYELALAVADSLSPETWRAFWVKQPDALSQDLRDLLWPDGIGRQAVLLSLGTGLAREVVQTFGLDELPDAVAVATAFAKG